MLKHVNSYFDPARGGHAPSDLRDAFAEAVEASIARSDPDEPLEIEVRNEVVTSKSVCGMLWNCTDMMPGHLCQAFEDVSGIDEPLTRGSTYAQGARTLKPLVEACPN